MFGSPSYGNGRGRIVAIVIAVVAAIVAGVLVAVIVARRHHHDTTSSVGARQVRIPAANGASLSALVLRPSGSARVPLLVMPASWSAAATQYEKAMPKLVARGFEVIAYAQRGVGGSTGIVDFAGPATQHDLSTVIDWAIGNTKVDAKHISAMGVSAGATVALLAAAQDPRIKAVAALSGTTDLDASFAPNGALAGLALGSLLNSEKVRDHLATEVSPLLTDLVSRNAKAGTTQLTSIADARSAKNDVAALNRNHTAIMLANAYQDSILPPANVLSFYSALTGPKRLQLNPGDHGMPELTGLFGAANPVWDDATTWVERYGAGSTSVTGADAGVVMTDSANNTRRTYRDVAAISNGTQSLYLGPSGGGTLAAGPATGWTRTVEMGKDSLVDLPPTTLVPPYTIATGKAALLGKAPGAEWLGPVLSQPATVNGSGSLHATVSSTTTQLGFVAYLYDVAADGGTQLMTYAPVSRATTPGIARQVLMDFQPISWTLAAGHRVALVVDGADPRFLLPTTGTVTFDGTSEPAVLTLPLAGS
jgi:predicted acyl esterase